MAAVEKHDFEPTIDWSKGAAWQDGEFVPASEAKLSVFDWGFTRSDVTYDVVHVWKGQFFRLEDHLDRFAHSVEGLRMELPVSRDGLADILHGCVARSGLQDSYVALVLTRGIPDPTWPKRLPDPHPVRRQRGVVRRQLQCVRKHQHAGRAPLKADRSNRQVRV